MKIAIVSTIIAVTISQVAMVRANAVGSRPTVTVQLLDVASGKGQLLVSLCDKATFMKRCATSQSVAAKRGGVIVTFSDIKPGRYAIMAFHDEDGNGRLSRTSVGAPSEGWGVSRDAKGVAGPPSFEQAAIIVTENGAVVPIHLTY